MKKQLVFKRYEMKYSLTSEEYKVLVDLMKNYMEIDEYKRNKITNIYYDTEDYKIIRNSLEKPKYKEKLRMRMYGDVLKTDKVFVELKKKFAGIVYKRRIILNKSEDIFDLQNINIDNQILKEIKYFMSLYNDIKPMIHLSYYREAYIGLEDKEFRMTFDFDIKVRNKNITFIPSEYDKNIIDEDTVILEVKTIKGLPSWFLNFLKENNIVQTSFSKYGEAYKKYLINDFKNYIGRLNYV